MDTITQDPWQDLRRHTAARLALGRVGTSLPTDETLRFGMAHAQARDAVHLALNTGALRPPLQALGLAVHEVHSAAVDRATYLLRPDLGRRLDEASVAALANAAGERGERGERSEGDEGNVDGDLALVIADGLSSLAVQRHAVPLIEALKNTAPPAWRIGPVVIATQARVALGDEIGERLGARLVAVLIGERPGLSSPDSLGIYLTWAPRAGRTDAERNCISNVRPEGLAYAAAAHKFWWLCGAARQMGLTGVALKDRSDAPALPAAPAAARLPGAA